MRVSCVLFALALLVAELELCSSASIQFTGQSGSWSTAGLWSPQRVPQSSDTVLIPAGSSVDAPDSIAFSSLLLQGTLTLHASQPLPGALTIDSGASLLLQSASLTGPALDLSGGSLHLQGTSTLASALARAGTITLGPHSTLSSLSLIEGETTLYGPSTPSILSLNISSSGTLGTSLDSLNASVVVSQLHWHDGAISQQLRVASLGTMDFGSHGLTGEVVFGPSSVVHWNQGYIDATYGSIVRVEGMLICGPGLDTCYFDGDTSLPQPQLFVTGTVDASAASYYGQSSSVFLYAFEVYSEGSWVGGIFSSTRTTWFVRSGTVFDRTHPLTLNGLLTDNFDVFGNIAFGTLNVKGHSVALLQEASFDVLFVSSVLYSIGDINVKHLFVTGTMSSSKGDIRVAGTFDVQGTFSNTSLTFLPEAVGVLDGTPRWINGATVTNEGSWTWNSSGYTFIDNTSKLINLGTIDFSSSDPFQVLPGVDYSGGEMINYGKIVLPANGASIIVNDPVSFLQCDGSIEFRISEASSPPYIQLSSSSAIGGGVISFQLDTPQTWASVPDSGIVIFLLPNGTSSAGGDVVSPIHWQFSSGSGRLCMGTDGQVRLYQGQKAPLTTQNCDVQALDGRKYCPVRSGSAPAIFPFQYALFSVLLLLALF